MVNCLQAFLRGSYSWILMLGRSSQPDTTTLPYIRTSGCSLVAPYIPSAVGLCSLRCMDCTWLCRDEPHVSCSGVYRSSAVWHLGVWGLRSIVSQCGWSYSSMSHTPVWRTASCRYSVWTIVYALVGKCRPSTYARPLLHLDSHSMSSSLPDVWIVYNAL
jgi:hypothetical protein